MFDLAQLTVDGCPGGNMDTERGLVTPFDVFGQVGVGQVVATVARECGIRDK